MLSDPRRRLVRLSTRVGRDHLALADDDHLLADLLHFRQNVRAENDGVIAGEAFDQRPGFGNLLRIEARGRLIEDQHVRVVNDGLREADALPVAFRQLLDQFLLTSATAQRSLTSSTRLAISLRAIPFSLPTKVRYSPTSISG